MPAGKVLFLASDAVALPALEVARAHAEKLVVVSGVDKPCGRGQKLTPNPVSAWALANKVELWRPERLDAEFMTKLQNFAPDFAVVMAYGKMLRQSFLDSFPKKVWNLHASDLPRLRGASPVETAVALGLTETAVTLMNVELKMDAGGVVDRAMVEIEPTMTGRELREAISKIAGAILEKHWGDIADGSVKYFPQEEAKATYCRILTHDDSWLDFNASALELANRVRAFAEWVGCCALYKGERLKIYRAHAEAGDSGKGAGTVLPGEGLRVACVEGILVIDELQKAGGKRLSAKDFLRGFPIGPGEVLSGGPLRELERSEPFPRGF
jgi:methionyl-tRNA formyltransferase